MISICIWIQQRNVNASKHTFGNKTTEWAPLQLYISAKLTQRVTKLVSVLNTRALHANVVTIQAHVLLMSQEKRYRLIIFMDKLVPGPFGQYKLSYLGPPGLFAVEYSRWSGASLPTDWCRATATSSFLNALLTAWVVFWIEPLSTSLVITQDWHGVRRREFKNDSKPLEKSRVQLTQTHTLPQTSCEARYIGPLPDVFGSARQRSELAQPAPPLSSCERTVVPHKRQLMLTASKLALSDPSWVTRSFWTPQRSGKQFWRRFVLELPPAAP